MTRPIISVENLGKKYLVGHQGPRERYVALRDVIGRQVKNFARKTRDMLRGTQIIEGDEIEPFWALRDVSFEIQPGEVVGIIGRNGAGKTTLLKILSRITEPSEGRVRLRGRVASLLEVGTGFHPELSGRENVFLNGAILGMTRAEINRKFGEIVAFAEVEKFLDTPVKHYSSGMYVRLAFSVAAHLEPEILVVDEVLAVGDAAFQKRCLGKMSEVADAGRTVLFVSHQMQAVSNLCRTAIELKNGRAVNRGAARDVVSRYLASTHSGVAARMWSLTEAPGDETIRLVGVWVEDAAGASPASFSSDQPIFVVLDVDCFETPSSLCVGFDLLTIEGIQVLRAYQTDVAENTPRLVRGRNRLVCTIPPGLLNGSAYQVAPRISLHNIKWCVKEDPVIQFQVALVHGKSPFWNSLSGSTRGGVVAPILRWQRSEQREHNNEPNLPPQFTGQARPYEQPSFDQSSLASGAAPSQDLH